ncbi:MAG: hypothetical protein JXA77_08935 [Bacteroidales bacterium]|nr:hypothetical protein [Bacteroidales bacterium]MBN2819565.1 hypothetical protein [Bacteroidales bacterium]
MPATKYRIEQDFIGKKEISAESLYGIHSVRARENFPDQNQFHPEWFMALGQVKKACYLTASDFFKRANEKTGIQNIKIKIPSEKLLNALITAAGEIIQLQHFNSFIVPAISGGAGTSINLNVNEIIANRAIQILGGKPGEYRLADPIEDANLFQSTNDVIPSSLKVATIQLLVSLEESINDLRIDIEQLEKKHINDLRKGYTQMQEAVPSSFGRLFSTYSDALSRDWWRISKCFERIKIINLGGSAIGSGITVPRFFIMEVSRTLQQITQLPITRGENLYDATNNLDSLVEVHGILKAHAVNLEKMVNDIRLLSSDIANKELLIPRKQLGSSIMPGKVNPVIPEFVISAAHKIYANDSLIASLCAQGCLELNAYLPTIGHALLESLKLLISCNKTLKENLFAGLEINTKSSLEALFNSASITTALVPYIGYNLSSKLAAHMIQNKQSIFEANSDLQVISEEKLQRILKPGSLLKEGFTLNDLLD